MNSETWSEHSDVRQMLLFLRGKTSDRKVRLFAVACCRTMEPLLADESLREAVEIAEQYADGAADAESRHRTFTTLVTLLNTPQATDTASRLVGAHPPALLAVALALKTDGETLGAAVSGMDVQAAKRSADCVSRAMDVHWRALVAAREAERHQEQSSEEAGFWASVTRPFRFVVTEVSGLKRLRKLHAALLREVVGNPFHPERLNPLWLTASVQSLALTIYDQKAFDRMPILGDALEEAGCDSDSVLEHCRSTIEHVRGCWVVDQVLGRE
jgi:hypothetical protein